VKTSRTLTFGGFTALVSTTILGSATVASAANVDGCGLEPDGGNLERNAGICELTFDSRSSGAWILPAGIAGLHAVLVGAGGGASYAQPNTGYSGAGGDVEFVDLTSYVPDDAAEVSVGVGGESGTPRGYDGQLTYLRMNGGSTLNVDGGNAGDNYPFGWGYCDVPFIGYFGENVGAGAGDPPIGGSCFGGGPGIVPDTDSDAPAIFDGFTTELGRGGGVFIDTTRSLQIGEGANVFYDSGNDATTADAAGADGVVIFRYTASDANNVSDSDSGSGSGSGSRTGSTNTLASTGNDVPVAAAALTSVAIIAAGVGAFAFGRRRSRVSR
jgi:hypothetical protein